MPKKTRRRPVRRRPQDRSEDIERAQRRLADGARGLIETRTSTQLRAELDDREHRLYEADQEAQRDPNPASLARYRAARSDVEVAKLALKISNDQSN